MAATQTMTLAWRLIVETQGIEKNTRAAANSLARIQRGASLAGQALRAIGIGFGARELLEMVGTYTNLQNKLKLVTENSAELATVQKELVTVANDTRSSFESTVELYSRMARSVKDLGLSQREVIDLTATVNQAIRVSGANAKEAEQGVIQFAQGLASGKLAGDELRAVLEQMPRLGQAVATGMGISYGQLRKLGAEGKLTTQAILDALKKEAPEIRAEFEKLAPTVGDAFEVMKSNFMVLVGEFDKGAGITEGLARIFLDVGTGMKSLSEAAAEFGVNFREHTVKLFVSFINFMQRLPLYVKKFVIEWGQVWGQASTLGFYKPFTEAEKNIDQRIADLKDEKEALFREAEADAQERRDLINQAETDLTKKRAAAPPIVDEAHLKFAKDYADALHDIAKETQELTAKQTALQFEIQYSKEAAGEFMDSYKGAIKADEIIRKLESNKEGIKLTAEQKDQIKALTAAQAENETQTRLMDESWELVKGTLEDTMTESETAAKRVDDLTFALSKLGGVLSDEQRKRIKDAIKEIADEANNAVKLQRQVVQTLFDNFTSFLAEGGFDVRKFVQESIKEIGKLIIQFLLFKALAGSSAGKYLDFGPFKRAKGGAFEYGNVVPFQRGGVVTGPTTFGVSGGRTGLMGEAGPEAIMPLARLPSGKLGVSASGGNVEVINNTGVAATARVKRTADRTSIVLEAAELGAQIAEERMTRSMRTGYGPTSTALQRTYALRRRG